MMSDLSQSGILEMVADNIIFAYRDEYYDANTSQPGILELILAKARHGDTGTFANFLTCLVSSRISIAFGCIK